MWLHSFYQASPKNATYNRFHCYLTNIFDVLSTHILMQSLKSLSRPNSIISIEKKNYFQNNLIWDLFTDHWTFNYQPYQFHPLIIICNFQSSHFTSIPSNQTLSLTDRIKRKYYFVLIIFHIIWSTQQVLCYTSSFCNFYTKLGF